MSRSIVIASAKVVAYVNGLAYGRVTDFGWTSLTPTREIFGVDCPEAFEFAPTITRGLGNMSLVRTIGDGGAQGAGMIARFPDLSRERYFTLTLVERVTDTTLFRADKCKVESESWSVPNRGIVTGQLQFKFVGWQNEVAGIAQAQ